MSKVYFTTTLIFFFLGAILLTLFTIWVYRSGAVHRSRHADGTLNTQSDWVGKFLSILFLLLTTALIVGYDFAIQKLFPYSIWRLTLFNFILLFLLTLFDSFVIDLWLLARIKPGFLNVPPEVTIESMQYHVKKTFLLGWTILIPISFIAAIIGYSIF